MTKAYVTKTILITISKYTILVAFTFLYKINCAVYVPTLTDLFVPVKSRGYMWIRIQKIIKNDFK